MALTVTTDLTVVTTAETVTGWTSFGSGGTGAMAIEPDFFAQGSNCISRGSAAAANKGMCFDIGAGSTINFTASTHQDKLVYIWMRHSSPSLIDTIANGGLRVVLGSGATAPADAAGVWSAWYVDGSNTLLVNNGWTCYVIDPQSTPSTTYGGGVDKTAVRWFGGVAKYIASAKGQTFGVDQISYGRGELRVSGTVTTAGAGFKEVNAVDFGTVGNRWGIITEKSGVYYVRGKIILGHATSNTTFSSQNETVVFETPYYYNANIVKSIPNASVGGVTGSDGQTTYNGLGIIGGSGTTTIDLGIIVGTNAGRSGSTLACPNNATLTTPAKTLATISASDASMALSLYGSSFVGFEGAIDLQGTNLSGDDCYSDSFIGCGRLDSNMEIRNCNILNSVASATDGAYIWNSTSDVQSSLFVNNSRAIVYESNTGTPFTFTNLTFSGNTYDVRNESGGAITINISGGNTPTKEDIGGGSATTIVSSVNATVAIKDQAGVAIPGAEVAIFQDNAARTILLASTATDSNGQVTTSITKSIGAIIIRARQSTNIASFLTSASGIDDANDIITTTSNHNFQNGDAVVYSKNGGTQNIGLTAGNTYYVRSISNTTLSLHDTAAHAIANTNKQAINVAGSETHILDPIRYVSASASGTIGTTDFSAQITMVTDNIATG